MKKNKKLLEFPCDFPIKIIGTHKDTFLHEITIIVRKFFPDLKDTAIRIQPSKERNYLAVTIVLHVKDQATLDALYQEVTRHPDIKMVL